MRYQAGDHAGAGVAWQASLAQAHAVGFAQSELAGEDGDLAGAAEFYLEALWLQPDLLPLAAECGRRF